MRRKERELSDIKSRYETLYNSYRSLVEEFNGKVSELGEYKKLLEEKEQQLVRLKESHKTSQVEKIALENEVIVDGELVKARLYAINATTFLGGQALVAQRDGVIVVVAGEVGTLEAGVSIGVHGFPTRIHYTVIAELVLPNGTAIPVRVN